MKIPKDDGWKSKDEMTQPKIETAPMACPICGWETPCRPTPEAADMRMSIHMGAGHTDEELKAHYAKVNEEHSRQNS